MGNRKRLAELPSAHRALAQLVEQRVRVVMKALHIAAGQNQERIGRASKVKFWRSSVVHSVEITYRHRGRRTFAVAHYDLRTEKNVRDTIACFSVRCVVSD